MELGNQSYLSRSLNDTERGYSAPERECLPVVWVLQTLRPYFPYENTTVFKDHRAVNWLFNISEPSGRLTRWRLRLSEFFFEIKYKKGADKHHINALSSLLTGSQNIAHEDDDIPAFHLSEEKDFDISSSTITSDCSQLEHQNYNQEDDFLKPEYEEYDHVLATHDVREEEPQFAKITLQELISHQYYDSFCSDICSHLNEVEGNLSPMTITDFLFALSTQIHI